jgi:hypothetical protein
MIAPINCSNPYSKYACAYKVKFDESTNIDDAASGAAVTDGQ